MTEISPVLYELKIFFSNLFLDYGVFSHQKYFFM